MKLLSLKIIGKLVVIASVLVVGVSLAIYGLNHRAANGSNGKLTVVAGESVWGNIISQIGGDKVQVTAIMDDPSADPHLYQPNAHDALAISQAKLVIANGLGYDDFLGKLLSASPNAQRSELTVADVLNVNKKEANPHLWYDLSRIPEVASVFEQILAQKDPTDKALFAANLQKFNTSLQPVLQMLAVLRSSYAHTPVAYTERVPGYLLADMNADVKTPTGFASAIENGSDPSPADQSAMQALIAGKQIKILLYNAQATSPATEHIRAEAKRQGIAVVGVTETIPRDQATYQSWQLNQLDALLAALKNT